MTNNAGTYHKTLHFGAPVTFETCVTRARALARESAFECGMNRHGVIRAALVIDERERLETWGNSARHMRTGPGARLYRALSSVRWPGPPC